MDTSLPTTLPLRPVADTVCVAPQLTPEAMAEAARLGFKSVINNRPDFEHGPDQPTSAAMEAAAQAAGLVYRHLPVDGGWQSPEQIAAFKALLAELPHPVLAFCRSGARSTRLYQQALAI
ncbi:MAG: TIGR01244 family phosphatase [Burkholderiaceae bacterium]|nr:TIGR01244 family phosphatase [Burkholderiaceae bacterium]